MTIAKSERLTVLSDAEQEALAERALHLPERRQDDRPGCVRGRAGFWMTEFSAVPAYNPHKL
jgi:hypothetical protein